MDNRNVELKKIKKPIVYRNVTPVFLTNETMEKRKEKLLVSLREEGYDCLLIYADREHGSNFEYLTGFIPRFEEGLLVLRATGECTLILGNENLKMAAIARIPNTLIHCPMFSLPDQPMDNDSSLECIFRQLGLDGDLKIGIAGWKKFTRPGADNRQLFDVPHFIVDAVRVIMSPETRLENAIHLLIDSEKGVRVQNNANEIAHYEYGANLASCCILDAMDAVDTDIPETVLGSLLTAQGQTPTVVTIAAAGDRFAYANLYPSAKKTQLGDPLSLTTGFKGGLSSRTGFIVENEEQLPEAQRDYLDKVAIPYFKGLACWLEHMKIGISGSEFYDIIDESFPKSIYGWHLNPGHLTSDEEWMASPISPGSNKKIKSGMIFQIDIIPSVQGYTGTSAEECVAVADDALKQEIKEQHPALWERIQARRHYIQNELNISLSEDILPLSNTTAYLRPFYLAKDKALCIV